MSDFRFFCLSYLVAFGAMRMFAAIINSSHSAFEDTVFSAVMAFNFAAIAVALFHTKESA